MMRSFWPVPLKNKRGNYKGRKPARADHFLCYRYPTLALEQGDLVQNIFHVNIKLWQSHFCRPIRHIPIVTYAAVVANKVNGICLYNPYRRPNQSVLRWLTNPRSRFRSRIVTFRTSTQVTSGTWKLLRMLERITILVHIGS